MNKLIALAALVTVSTTGCAVRVVRQDRPARPLPPPPPVVVSRPALPPPPAPVVRRLSRAEARAYALRYANGRGFSARVKDAHLKGHDLWKVKLEVERPGAHGRLHVELDAFSGAVVRAQEHVKVRKPPRRDRGRFHEASAVARR